MPEPGAERSVLKSRLARIYFPRMEVEDRWLLIPCSYAAQGPARNRIGEQPEVSATSAGKITIE